MSQPSIEIRIQLLVKKAKNRDKKAISELAAVMIQMLEKQDFSQNMAFGLGLLKNLKKYGDDILQSMLAKHLDEFATNLLDSNPQLGYRLFVLANTLGSLRAKVHLAVCLFNGTGTEKQPDKAISLLKEDCYKGDQSVLEDITKVKPKDVIELLKVGSALGNLESKLLLAIYFLISDTDINKVIHLLKECHIAGKPSSLDDIDEIANRLLLGEGCKKDIEHSIKLYAYAAQHGHQRARYNLHVLANHFLLWGNLEKGSEYGIQQDILKGVRILHYLASLNDTEAIGHLADIRALKIPMPTSEKLNIHQSGPNHLAIEDSTIGLPIPTPEEPHSPRTVTFLSENNISISTETGVSIAVDGINGVVDAQHVASSLLAKIEQFTLDRATRKMQEFIDVLAILQPHVPVASIQGIIREYALDKKPHLLFQYQRAIESIDKNPQLACLNTEETPCDFSSVKIHV